jgi:16S rRNA (guanine527-N7)-methyltransferase
VIAIACPECRVALLDSSGKRVRFCRQAAGELGLRNVEVVHARFERLEPARRFTDVVSRAFGSLADFVPPAVARLEPGGRVLAMKGRVGASELEELGPMGENAAVIRLNVPGLAAERNLVVFGSPR